MKKILLAFDGTQFSEGAFHFARRLNELQPVLLTGVFLPQVSFANLWSYSTAIAGPVFVPMIEQDEADAINQNINRFEQLCRKHNIKYRVHKDFYDFALPELQRESRFADLLILSSEKFYHNIAGEDTFRFLSDALKETECPVLVVPEEFDFPTKNMVTYDGSESSVFAIKQFVYLFPELCHRETTVLYLSKKDETALPHETELKELVQQHFKDVNFLKLNINPKKDFNGGIGERKHILLIGGSFGRSSVSQLFKKSFLHDVIADHKLPVFIAHK